MTSEPSANAQNLRERFRLAGIITLIGSACMLIGAVLWGSTGTDLWAALDGGDMAAYLRDAGAVKTQLVANLTFWIIGTIVLSFAGSIIASLNAQRWALAQAILLCYRAGVSIVVISYLAMLALVVLIAPDTSDTAVYIAKVVGWIGARADDIATALFLGAGPLFISLAGHGDWAPAWLLRWSYLAFLCGLLSIVFLYFPGMSQYGFIIVPVGMGWMVATGIVLLRKRGG